MIAKWFVKTKYQPSISNPVHICVPEEGYHEGQQRERRCSEYKVRKVIKRHPLKTINSNQTSSINH